MGKTLKSQLKKVTCLLLVGLMGTACACTTPPADSSTSETAPNYTAESYDFTTIFVDGARKNMRAYNDDVPEENGSVVYDVYSNLGNKNYLKIELETDVNLVGYIHYYSNSDASVTNTEKFYVEAGSTEFTTFLDAFRVGAYGAFEKTLATVTFKSVDSTKEGSFTLKSIGISDRSFDTNEDLRISDGKTVLGTSGFYGGCISYLEGLDQDIYEYMDSDGNICIDRDVDPDSVYKMSRESVNLVNICDLGREIQPSYYSAVGPANGYDPEFEPGDVYQGLTGGKAVYNPIQCGDYGGHTPQIIDYNYQSNYLYIKMKAQEWFFLSNIQANGYIEVTYSFKDGAVLVDNRYTDFSEFVGEWDIGLHMQETPATYFVYPLNYFYCETKQGTIFDPNCSPQNGRSQEKTSLKASVTGEYFYAVSGKMVTNGWCAFVNQNKFGVGIYMPNADRYIASRGEITTNYFNGDQNTRYYPEFFTFDQSEIIPSYATFNYSYINPSIIRKMVDFVPLEYTYALYIGSTEEMGELFEGFKKDGVAANEHLADPNIGWPKK